MKNPEPIDISKLSEPILQALSEIGQGIALVHSKTKEILYANEAFCLIAGYSQNELTGLPSLLHLLRSYPNTMFSDAPAVSHVRTVSSSIDAILVHKSGTPLNTELSVYRLPLASQSDCLVVLLRDVTRRKRTEEQIQLFQTIGIAVNDACDFSNALGMVLRKVCVATGWEYGEAWVPNEEINQLTVNPVWYGADNQMENLRRVRESLIFHLGESLPGRVWMEKHPAYIDDLGSDGDSSNKNVKWEFGLESGMAIPAISGDKVVAVLVFFVSKRNSSRDAFRAVASIVTPQLGTLFLKKKAEETLKETNIFLDSIIENIPDMVFIKDAKDLRFVRFNKAGEGLLGIPREKMIGKTDYDFFPKAEADFFTKKDRLVLEEGKLVDIPEEKIHTGKGVRLLHTKKIPIWDENKKPIYLLGISEDITNKKK